MNYIKVDELLAKAGCKFEFLHAYDYENFSPYQFAELILNECIDVLVDVLPATVPEAKDGVHPVWHIKQHFGVA